MRYSRRLGPIRKSKTLKGKTTSKGGEIKETRKVDLENKPMNCWTCPRDQGNRKEIVSKEKKTKECCERFSKGVEIERRNDN